MVQGDARKVGRSSREQMEELQRSGKLYLSDVSVLELARLEAEGRVDIGMSVERAIELSTKVANLQILPLSQSILIQSTRLPGKVHRDPADRLLIATAREHGLTLMTRDKLILDYARQGHLNVRKL